jgi:uncharacterized protein involved in exopolysaccharide biosynthesis
MTNHEDNLFASGTDQPPLSRRDIVEAGFRHKGAMLLCFGTLVVAAILYCFVLTPKYQFETKILVQKERLDPVVSTDQQAPITHDDVTEQDLNSEIELINSDDVLRKVAAAVDLENVKVPGVPNPIGLLVGLFTHDTPAEKTAKAVIKLQKDLDIEEVKKSNIITITYDKRDIHLGTRVLRALDAAYLEKHYQVHRPSGQYQFFEEKTADYRNNLAGAEDQLRKFSQASGSVNPQLARDIALQSLSTFDASLHQTRAAIADAQNRIDTLKKEEAAIPARMTTSSRRTDNAPLLSQLKDTLLTLELKRNELLSKFQPDYRPVQEVEQEIAKTKAAIAVEDSTPLRDETTDTDPTHQWIENELAKATADLKGLQAQASATEHNVREYQAVTHDLQNKEITAEDLTREVKAAEQNYLLYLKKREESRIADALDKTHILNVSIAEPPTTPALPKHAPALIFLICTFVAAMVSVGLVFLLEFMNSSFRTPREIEAVLNLPVLAAVPQSESNGNGNRRGWDKHGNGWGHDDITEPSVHS